MSQILGVLLLVHLLVRVCKHFQNEGEQKDKKIKHQFQIISLRAIIGRQSKTKHKSCIRTLDKHTFDKNNFVLLKTTAVQFLSEA